MMKVVGISGAQGAGKSSLLTELSYRGFVVDSFKVSRVVQAQLGWTELSRVKHSFADMQKFQEEVFKQKYKHDNALATDGYDGVILTERTFADICAYTNLWTWGFVDSGQVTLSEAIGFLSGFTTRCADAQNNIYAGTLLLPLMDHVVFVEDPNRASKKDASLVYQDIEAFVDRKTRVMHRRYRIRSESVCDRAGEVQTFLGTL